MEQKTIISTDGKLTVEILSSREPNNGRMLWKVRIKLDGENIDRKVFGGNWTYINFEIENWLLNDNLNRCYYIPVEGTARLIIKENQQIISLPKQGLSTITFFGNLFYNNDLIEIYNDQIVLTDLTTYSSRKIETDETGRILAFKLEGKQLHLDYYKLENNKRQKFTKVINLYENQSHEIINK